MKAFFSLIPTLALGFACGTLRTSEAVDSAPRAADRLEPACAGEIHPATVECTPQGTCIVRVGEGPERCEVELACDGSRCEVVRCDGPQDCAPPCRTE